MTNPTSKRRRLGCGTPLGLMAAASLLTFFVLKYEFSRPKEVGAQLPSPFPVLLVGLGPTPSARVVDAAELTAAASESQTFIIPPGRAAAIQAALDQEMQAEAERARRNGDREAYRKARFTIERTEPRRQRIRLDYTRNGMDAIVRTTTWYDATDRGVEPRRIGKGVVNGMLIFLSLLIGTAISAAIGLGLRFVRRKKG